MTSDWKTRSVARALLNKAAGTSVNLGPCGCMKITDAVGNVVIDERCEAHEALPCGRCYRENGIEVHPHPECAVTYEEST